MSASLNACDLWIDTTELKEKKRKRQTRPIAKLLNPLARGGGYSVAVALNFTQTKLAMPATKQSTISSFFSPRQKDIVNKPTLSPEPCEKSKERWLTDFESQNSMKNSETESDFSDICAKCLGQPASHVLRTDHPNYSCNWKKEQTFLHLIRGYESEEEVDEPEAKRRHSVPCSILPIPETLPLIHQEHNTQESQFLKPMHPAREDGVFSVSPKSERDFRAQLPQVEHTSTQSRLPCTLHSIAKHSWKENCPSQTTKWKDLGWSQSPLKIRPLSPSRPAATSRPWELRWQSPQKPLLKGVRKELETDSMASLFTQDSQGFRVIAHRSHQSGSPLKDRTNNASPGAGQEISVGAPDRDNDQEQESEMLFTQDSQGNLVIKH